MKTFMSMVLTAMGMYYLAVYSANALQLIQERPEITHINYEYLPFLNVTTRHSRGGAPLTSIHARINHAWGNNITLNFVVFEFLSNQYRRSFVQFSAKVCDAVTRTPILSHLLQQTELINKTCPYPPGEYHLVNITASTKVIPKNFPFSKGRIDIDILLNEDKSTHIVHAHILFEIRGELKQRH